jgi:hypothetical protein
MGNTRSLQLRQRSIPMDTITFLKRLICLKRGTKSFKNLGHQWTTSLSAIPGFRFLETSTEDSNPHSTQLNELTTKIQRTEM